MERKYITIEREYGSGGTKIARLLAEECNIPCYGREILEAVAKKRGTAIEQIEQYEEKAASSTLWAINMKDYSQPRHSNVIPQEMHIFLEEQQEILRFARKGSAIFLGHCASEALKEQNGVAKVFIWAEMEDKVRRIREDYGIENDEIEATRKFYDKKRANYYHANVGKKWGDWKNYDIILNSSALGIEGCANVLKGLLQ